MCFQIRERTDRDIAQCAQLLRAVHKLDDYPKHFPDDPIAWLCSHRRAGVASALLAEAVAAAHADGKRPVLDVLQSGEAAIALYERAGWELLGPVVFRSPAGDALPAYVFAGPLPPL